MSFPTPWAAVLLDDPLDPDSTAASLAARLAPLGLSATPTREGWLALSGDLLARLVRAPYPPDLFAHPGALAGPTRAHPAYLEISGGGLDVDRPIFEHASTMPREPTKTGRFRKIERASELLVALAPLGQGVVLPVAGHRFVPWSLWPSKGAGEVFAAFVTLARGQAELSTRGLRAFGVPEMGAAIGGDVAACTRALFDAAFEAAWQGFVPTSTAKLSAYVDRAAGAWTLARVAREGVWVTDRGGDPRGFALHASLVGLVGPHLFDDPEGAADEPRVALFGSTERRLASTIGLHRLDRAKGPIEIVAFSPRLSRHAAYAIRQVAAVVRASPDALDAYHRVAMPPLESVGIAGVVLWPSGHLPLGSSDVTLLEAFPITAHELARFRAGEQEAWMSAVEAQSAFGVLQSRWCGAA
jgi:hypothetical protein